MVKLYSNENFPMPAVEELRKAGYDVLTIQETGMAQRALPDEDVLNFASKEGRAVLTFNRKHFISLHKKKQKHAGIIVCSFDLDFKGLADRIHQKISRLKSISDKLIKINRPSK